MTMRFTFVCLFLLPMAAFAQGAAGEKNIVEREAMERARKSGFGDLEVDNLHGSIARSLAGIVQKGGLVDDSGSYKELIESAMTRRIVTGKDAEGKTYIRLRLREGLSTGTAIFPVQYIYRAHCYLYPAQDGTISKIVFQFYRINYSGTDYIREIRRFVHPDPRDKAQASTKKIGAEMELLDNSKLTLEHYEAGSDKKASIEGPDGVPSAVLKIEPNTRVILNEEKEPIPYEKQVRILSLYKKLLRKIDHDLRRILHERDLERNLIIEKVLDFSG